MTRPDMCRVAVGRGAADEPVLADASGTLLGADAAENSTRETWSVKFNRTRWDSVEPVADVVVTRLNRKSS